jgi:hypothetical protein
VWDDTVRDIAAVQARGGEGLPAEVVSRIHDARTWLDDYSPIPRIDLRSRTPEERNDRRVELDAILATAPDDQRSTIKQLWNGQLSLTDTGNLLAEVTSVQSCRAGWIAANWPTVVESLEVLRNEGSSAADVEIGPLDKLVAERGFSNLEL